MEKFYNDIRPLIQKLSEIFCISTEYLQEHLMDYIIEYGKYYVVSNYIDLVAFMLLLFICALVGIAVWLNTEYIEDEAKKYMKTVIKYSCTAFIGLLVVLFILCIAPYLASPMMYSIEKVMRLI